MRRLRSRPDTEHEMRFNGIIFGSAILAYLLETVGFESSAIIVPPLYIAYNFAVLGHILRRPGACRPRRTLSILGDFTALFWVMHIGGETTAVLFPIYLWVILGNGFRFGLPFLALATAGGVASFAAVVATTSFWGSHPALSAGLFGGIVLVPLAAVPLIRQLSKAKQRAETATRETSFILASVGLLPRTPLRPPSSAPGSVLQRTPSSIRRSGRSPAKWSPPDGGCWGRSTTSPAPPPGLRPRRSPMPTRQNIVPDETILPALPSPGHDPALDLPGKGLDTATQSKSTPRQRCDEFPWFHFIEPEPDTRQRRPAGARPADGRTL